MSRKDEEATLVDYFVVAGYDPETGLIVENNGDGVWGSDYMPSDSLRPPLQRSFVPKIIEHYPKKRRSCQFSPEVISLCMPKGLRFYTEKTVPPHVEVHTFANIREDGSRINGTALTFYEEVMDPTICAAMAALQQEHVKRVTAGERNNEGRDHLPPGTVSGGTHTLPRGKRNIGKRISYYDGGGHGILYMSKTLCLISRLPIVGGTQTLLQMLYKLASNRDMSSLPLESYIYWMLNEVPLPSIGTTLKVRLLDHVIVVQRPSAKELPFFDYPLSALFEIVSIDRFVRIFTAFLLEHQIVVCSKDLSHLMIFCESLCSLAFPFRWQLTYVPILPTSQLKFIEAPVPYVMGVCIEEGTPQFLQQSNICVLDIDTGRGDIPEDLQFFPEHKLLVAQIKSILTKYAESSRLNSNTMNSCNRDDEDKKGMRMSRSFDLTRDDSIRLDDTQSRVDHVLHNNNALARVTEIARRAGVKVELDTLINELDEKSSCTESIESKCYFHDMCINNAIRECFASRMASIFLSYEKFVLGNALDKDDDNRDSVVCFDKAGFMADHKLSYLPFLAAFLETQMFASFIDTKLMHCLSPDENISRFDGMINEMERNGDIDLSNPIPLQLPITEDLVLRREEQLDYVVPSPHILSTPIPSIRDGRYLWPSLYAPALTTNETMSPMPSPWKQRYARLRPNAIETVRPLSSYGAAGISADSPDHQNAKFVEQLLKETKGKTKRILVEKMGKEAVELGHGDGLSGVEENTLVAALCDLLERIWSHGHAKKHGKSSLWTMLLSHEECDKLVPSHRSHSTSYLAPVIRPYPRVLHPSSSTTTTPSIPLDSSSSLLRRTSLSSSRHHNSSSSPLPPLPPRLPQSSSKSISTLPDLSSMLASMDISSSIGGDGDDWKSSLYRAANSLVEKLGLDANGEVEGLDGRVGGGDIIKGGGGGSSGGVLSNAWGRLNQVSSTIKKSNSISDFTSPSWPNNDDGSQSAREGRRGRDSSIGWNERGERRQRSRSRAGSPETHYTLVPLSTSISYDLKNVLRMSEIKSELGYARAFIRLALERRLLHKHLQTLLSNTRLINECYKPYALVRQDDEKEQFLMHIISLNAAPFRCFTNTFTKTRMEYQVVLSTGSWTGHIPPIWFILYGSNGQSTKMSIHNTTKTFRFVHSNLGFLSSLTIGHGSDKPPKWYLDNIIIRNDITGARYCFPCGRWFGRGVDDGSIERLLIANLIPDDEKREGGIGMNGMNDDTNTMNMVSMASPALRRGRRSVSRSQTPLRDRSPSIGRTINTKSKLKAEEIEEMLGDVVNALIRHLDANPDGHNRAELIRLLHGPDGLLESIEAAFHCGRSEGWSGRLFRGVYPWDYIEKVSSWMSDLSRSPAWKGLDIQKQQMMKYTVGLVNRINEKEQLGKEGKFHVFVLVAVRDHSFCGLLSLMACTPITHTMYNSSSFIRNSQLLARFSKLLDSLSEFSLHIDLASTHGII